MSAVATLRYRLPDGVELLFRFTYDGPAVPDDEWVRGPQCRARTAAGHRCRNLVLEGQPGPHLPDDPPGLVVEEDADAVRLREQACRVHVGTAFAEFCDSEWSRIR